MTPEARSIFYQEGKDAKKLGIKYEDCPYRKGSEMRRLWEMGYNSEGEE